VRDIIISMVLLGMFPACYRRPFIGLLVFSWLAYMRVQDLTWGFARGMRWSYYVAIITFVGFLNSREKKRLFLPDVRCYLMLLLLAFVGIGVALSKNPDPVQLNRLVEFAKIIGIALFTTAVVQTREHLRVLIWVIACSFAFYGVKSGVWGVLTGGATAIKQGPGGMLADNNDFSLAMAMAVPILVHVGLSERREILRKAFLYSVPLTIITVALTHSRGGFLALAGGSGVLIWHSRSRISAGLLAFFVAILAVIVAPTEYKERISSIGDYESDGSAQARFRSWAVAVRMASANPMFGVGLNKFRANYLRYEPNPTGAQIDGKGVYVAHNSYLQIWAEVGTPAFAIYLTLILLSFVTVWRTRAKARRRFYSSWVLNYCTMFEASLLTFCIGAVFLNRAHFDLFYHFIAIVLVFGYIANEELGDEGAYPLRASGVRGDIRFTRRPGFGHRMRGGGFRNTPLQPAQSGRSM